MINEVLYKFNDDPEYFECCQVDICVASYNEDEQGVPDLEGNVFDAKSLAEAMAGEIYSQSCGDQEFPINLHIYTMDKKHLPLKATTTNISPDAAAERLKDFCKGFTWIRADERRFSTVVGVGIAATKYDGDKALSAIEEKALAAEFINNLEAKYKQYNDVGFSTNKRQAIKALNAAWVIQSQKVFVALPVAVQLPDDVVGMKSGVLNKAQEGFGGNVVSFNKKVADKTAAAKESNSD